MSVAALLEGHPKSFFALDAFRHRYPKVLVADLALRNRFTQRTRRLAIVPDCFAASSLGKHFDSRGV